MLIEFSVKNFLSFKEKATLSMAASSDKSLPQNVIQSAQGTDFNLLKSAAVYGANASGKSNLFKAMNFMTQFVGYLASEGQKDSPIDVTPFKLDLSFQKQPSEFEAIFLVEGIRYQYGFVVDKERVHEEWLYSYPKGQRRVLFERSRAPEDENSTYEFGPHWHGEKQKLVSLTRADALFISVAAQFNHKIAMIIVNFFLRKILCIEDIYLKKAYNLFMLEESERFSFLKEGLVHFLKQADFNISDFKVKHTETEDIDKFLHHDFTKYRDFIKFLLDTKNTEIETIHRVIDEDGKYVEIPLSFEEESDGTKKFFNFFPSCFAALVSPSLLIIDELDIHLHPLLTRLIINIFNGEKVNLKGAQLIFTTHDSNLLEQDLFRRDQIWFTEKNPQGGTELYSLWDYKPRKGENIRKGYLAGRYGAVPFIGDFTWGLESHG